MKFSILPSSVLAVPSFCIAASLFALSAITSCQGEDKESEPQEAASLEEPSNDFTYMPAEENRPFRFLDVEPSVATADPVKGDTVWYLDGTSVEVPAGALVFEDGTPCTEPVEISFTEYDSPAKIITSGINMTCMEDGKMVPFISSGMFRVEGKCQGKTVKVKEGQNLKVNLATYNGDDGYAEWVLDEETNQWSQIGMNQAQRNTMENQLKAASETAGKRSERDMLVLDMGESSPMSGVAWRLTDPMEEGKWKNITNNKWDKCHITAEKSERPGWKVQLSSTGRKASFQGVPVIPTHGAFRDKFETAFEDAVAETEIGKMPVRDGYLRSMSIPAFGTFNCDIKGREKTEDLPLFVKEGSELRRDVSAYLICPELNGTINFNGPGMGEFFYFPKKKCYLLVTADDGSYDLRRFDDQSAQQVVAKGHYQVTWNKNKVKTLNDLAELMSQLS